jgi:hypothetical protein
MFDPASVFEQFRLLDKEHGLQRPRIESVQIFDRKRRFNHARVWHERRPKSRTKPS